MWKRAVRIVSDREAAGGGYRISIGAKSGRSTSSISSTSSTSSTRGGPVVAQQAVYDRSSLWYSVTVFRAWWMSRCLDFCDFLPLLKVIQDQLSKIFACRYGRRRRNRYTCR